MSTLNAVPEPDDSRIQSILSKISSFEQEISRLRSELSALSADEADGLSFRSAEPQPDGLGNHLAALHQAAEDLRQKRTPSEVLEALIEHSARFAPRVALFLIKSASLVLRTARGFGDRSDQLKGFQVPLELDTLLRQVAQSKTTNQCAANAHSKASVLTEKLNLEPEAMIAGTPLLIFGKVAGVVYSDSGDGQQTIELDALEMLTLAAGGRLEALTAEQRGVPKPNGAPQPEGPSHIVGMHSFSPSPATTPGCQADSEQLTELERSRQEAIRIAKIMVQEILLYNGPALDLGRMNRDIYDRVRVDLDRSREMYTRRIEMASIGYHDYLHDEIVRVLCNNDASRLGPNYPGPLTGAQ